MKRKPWSPRRDMIEGIIFLMALPFLVILIVGFAFAIVMFPFCVIDWAFSVGLGVCHGR